MKPYRILTALLLGLLSALLAGAAQTKPSSAFEPVASLPIKGSLNIAYNTRTQLDGDKPKAGVTDVYSMNLNVANSALFKGTISHLPYVANRIGADQVGRITYEMDLDVVNPNNPAQTRNVGKMFGSAPIDKQNVYRYSDGGGVKVAVFPIGAAKGFESRFNGLALAKPPANTNLMSKIKQEAVRLVSSKGGAIVLTKYDKMSFENHQIPAGPVQIYPEVTVTGTLFYDYGRSAWHFNNVTFIYTAEGKRNVDTLTGSIRWIEAPNRKTTGEGRYEFDIRVNEPAPTESAIFAAAADESAFFASDDSSATLTGAMNYKDTLRGDTVVSSMVQIDLKANKLSKQQAMMLAKLILLSSIVPFNAE